MVLALACSPADVDEATGTASTGEATTGDHAPTTGEAASTGSSTGESAGDDTTGEPPVDGLRVHELQALGTHNSYHVSSGPSVKDLDYTHKPLAEQLASGVRQFELDVHFGAVGEPIAVHHLELLDEGTTCAQLTDCLAALRGWSDQNPTHHLLYVMIEVKSPSNANTTPALLGTLEEQSLASGRASGCWPRTTSRATRPTCRRRWRRPAGRRSKIFPLLSYEFRHERQPHHKNRRLNADGTQHL